MASNSTISSTLHWVSQMNVDVEPQAARKTSIICTIGPKTNNVEKLTQLMEAGMNICRLNFSHGSYEVSYFKVQISTARSSAHYYSALLLLLVP